MVDTSNVQIRRAMAILDREIDRREPMRFLQHREVMAWKRRRSIDAVADLVRRGKVYIPTGRTPWAQQFRGGPLVV